MTQTDLTVERVRHPLKMRVLTVADRKSVV